MEQMQQDPGANNAGNTIGWLEKVLAMEQRYGLRAIFNSFLIIFVAIVVGWIAFNPTSIIDKIQKAQTAQHKESIELRKQADPIIKNCLANLRNELHADRAFLFETHNGGSNLDGLPFLYVDMTYDEPATGKQRVQDEYKNLSQTRYDFMDYVYRNTFWMGSIEALMEHDMELYYRLQKVGITHMAVLVIYGSDLPSGAIGVVFSGNIPEQTAVRQAMHRAGSKIASLICTKQ